MLPLVLSLAVASGDLDALMERYFDIRSPAQKTAVFEEILSSGNEFDEIYAALQVGRPYSADVPTGRIARSVTIEGVLHPHVVLVPEDYTPEKRYPVRFEVHGGLGVPPWDPDEQAWAGNWQPVSDQIVILPAGWVDSMWWEPRQALNFLGALKLAKRRWNIDENRIVFSGNSDGGAAAFFQAMRTPDAWAGYAAFVGPPDRLVRAEMRPAGQMHVCNLAGQRFHLGYGEKDSLVPWKHMKRYLELFEEAGAEIDWFLQKGKGHSLGLSDEQVNAFLDFLLKTKRDPLPDKLTWATESTEDYARRSWVIIESLDPREPEPDRDDRLPRWGTRIQLRGATVPRVPYGRVDVERSGNEIRVQSWGVGDLRLLLSPGSEDAPEFDFEQPIRIWRDGELVFEELVRKDVATLLEWAYRDEDRTRLFAAEVLLRQDAADEKDER